MDHGGESGHEDVAHGRPDGEHPHPGEVRAAAVERRLNGESGHFLAEVGLRALGGPGIMAGLDSVGLEDPLPVFAGFAGDKTQVVFQPVVGDRIAGQERPRRRDEDGIQRQLSHQSPPQFRAWMTVKRKDHANQNLQEFEKEASNLNHNGRLF